MRTVRNSLFAISLLFIIFGISHAQIQISIPDTTALPGASIMIPIYTEYISPFDSVQAYQLTLNYDMELAEYNNFEIAGSLTPAVGWMAFFYQPEPGTVNGGAFMTTPPYLEGEGALVYLIFDIPEYAVGVCPLHLDFFIYNEGTPETVTLDGSITFIGPPDPFSLLAPAYGDTVWELEAALEWEETFDPDPGDIPHYDVWVGNEPDLSDAWLAADSIEATNFLLTDLEDDLEYYWTVRATDSNTPGTWATDTLMFRTYIIEAPAAFALASPPNGAVVNEDTVEVSWTASSDPDPGDEFYYQVDWSLDAAFAAFDSAITADTSYVITDIFAMFDELPDDETIYWRVKAVDSFGLFTWADPGELGWFFIVDIFQAPSAFGLLLPGYGERFAVLEVELSWEEAVDPDPYDDPRYDVWVGNEPDLSDAWLAADSIAETSFLLTDLQDDLLYYWTVRATDSNTSGTWAEDTLMFQIQLPIQVYIPDTTASPGTTVMIPVYTEYVSPLDSVQSYDITLTYDSELIEYDTYDVTGCVIPSNWFTFYNEIEPGVLDGGAFMAMPPYLEGEGALVYLVFDIPVTSYGVCPLEFEMFLYNEEYPPTITVNGSITIIGAPQPFSLLSPAYGDTVWELEAALEWEESFDPDPFDDPHYDVWVGNEPDLSDAWLAADSIEATEFLLTDLEDDLEYYWTVRATDSNTPGTWANDTLMFQTYVPEAPAAFALASPPNGTVVNEDTVEVSWTASSDPDPGDEFYYQVDWSLDAVFATYDSAITADTFYVITDIFAMFDELPDDETVYWRVKAVDSFGLFTWADPGELGWFFIVDVYQSPSAFGLISPANGDTSWILEAELIWEESVDPDPYDVVHYDVWVGNEPDLSDASLVADSIEATNFLLADLEDDLEYYWTVRATDSNTPGTWATDTLMFRTYIIEAPGAFALASPPNGAVVNEDTVEVSWTASSDPDPGDEFYYQVDWSLDAVFATFDSAITADTFYVITDIFAMFDELPDDETIYWRVKAVDSFGLFTWADPGELGWSFIVDVYQSPSAFGLLLPEYGEVFTVLEVELSWEESEDPDPYDVVHYDVWVGNEPDLSDAWLAADSIVETFFLLIDLQDDLAYYWTVRATDSNTPGTWAEDSLMFQIMLPIQVSVPEVAVLPGESVTIPINTEYVSANDSVQSYDITLNYDNNLAVYDTFNAAGSIIPSNWMTFYNEPEPGVIDGGAFMAMPPYLEGEGALVYLTFDIPAASYGVCPLEFEMFMYNEGVPQTYTVDGAMNILGVPSAFSLLEPSYGDTIWALEALLGWEESFDPDPFDTPYYDVWVGNEPDLSEAWLAADSIADVSFLLTNLQNETAYYWTVRATDSNTPGTWASDTLMFHTLLPQAPGPFALASPGNGAVVHEDEVEVSWTESFDPDPGDVIEYNVQWTIDPTFTVYDSAITENTSYLITDISQLIDGLPDDIDVYWRVKAFDTFGLFTWANPGEGGWYFIVDLFQSPSAFGLTAPDSGEVFAVLEAELTWEEADDPDPYDIPYYDVWVGNEPDLSDGWLAADSIPDTEFLLTGLDDDMTYYWTVRATDSNTPGTWADETWMFQTYVPEAPGAFALSGPANGGEVHEDEVEVSWTESFDPDPGDEFLYHVQWTIDPTFAEYDSAITENTSYIITDISSLIEGLPDDLTIYWRVKAVDGFELFTWANPGENGWSFIVNVYQAPSAFGLLTPTNGDTSWILEVELTWEESEDPDPYDTPHYDVWVGNEPDLSDGWLAADSIAETEFLLNGLADDMTYYWTVRATDSNTPGTWADETWMFQTYVPEAPGAFALSSPANGGEVHTDEVEVSWTESFDPDPGDVFLYHIQWTIDPTFTVYDSAITENTSYIITDISSLIEGLPDDLTIYWRVKAVDSFELFTWANPGENGWSFIVNVYQVPSAFGLLTPANGDTSWILEAELTWEEAEDPDPYDIPYYDVWVGNEPDLSDGWLAADSIAETEFLLSGLADDMTYYWTVRATDSNTPGTWADETWMFQTYVPEAPGAFALSAPANGGEVHTDEVEVSWTASSDPDPGDVFLYHIQWTIDPTFTVYDSAITENTSYIITDISSLIEGLPDDLTIYWRVKAVDGFELFTWANPGENGWSFIVNVYQAPSAFGLLTPANGDTSWILEAELTWEEADDPDPYDTPHYDVWVGNEPDLSDGILVADSIEAAEFTLTDLDDDMTYYWTVRATDSNTPGTWADETWMFQTYMPEAPGAFALSGPANGGEVHEDEVEVSWTASSDPDPGDEFLYHIQWTIDPTFTVYDSAITENTSYLITDISALLDGLPDDETIYWRVKAVDGFELFTWANPGENGWSFIIDVFQAPDPFALISPADGDTCWMLDTLLVWEEAFDPDPYDTPYYDVWLDTLADLSTAWMTADSIADANFELTDLMSAHTYYWTVRATDSNTPGTWSDDTLHFVTNPYASISGNVNYFMGEAGAVPEVELVLDGFLEDTVFTDVLGFYNFDNILIGNDYTVVPSKWEQTWASPIVISFNDAVFAAQGAAGLMTLTDEQVIAADVEGGTGLNFFDAVMIAQYASMQIEHFGVAVANNSDWAFIPGENAYSPLTESIIDDYLGILYGDVTGNWSANFVLAAKTNDDELFGTYKVEGDTVSVPVMVTENQGDVYFVQISLEYNPERLEFLDAALTGLTQGWILVVPEIDESNRNKPGDFNMGIFNIEPLTKSGPVFELRFKMLDTESDIELTMSDYRVSDYTSYSSGIVITPVVIPDDYALEQNYPNPFNPETTIRFAIKEQGHVTLTVYNIMGRRVCTLVDENKTPGNYSVVFKSVDDSGGELASGIYFYHINCNDFDSVKKMVLVK